MIMFAFCALAYLAAWIIMKMLVPTQATARLPEELAHA
jgi:ACS family hexuronate transporter-like MFS transporter